MNKLLATAVLLSAAATTAMAVSKPATPSSDYRVGEHNGVVSKGAISVAARKLYPGIVPKITYSPTQRYVWCYKFRGIYQGELVTGSFNCTASPMELPTNE